MEHPHPEQDKLFKHIEDVTTTIPTIHDALEEAVREHRMTAEEAHECEEAYERTLLRGREEFTD